ncbi:hypothetical protein B0H12DRAFT_1158311 [Mycena haematopus]|nr:hypothetical protein B0H12DRAFT_1158311 [Mycena haematopus]
MRDDIDELFDRVMDLERFESAASSGAAVFSTRVSALEDRTPAAGGQITTALTAALASRFQDITSDRDKLNNEIRFQAEKHAHEIRSQAEKQAQVRAKLQRAQDELLKTLSGLQVTIARLELSIPAPPLRLPARLSDTEQRHVLSAPSKYPRPRSPAPRAHSPAPRARSPAPRGRSPVPRIRSPPPRSRSPAIGGSLTKRPKILGFLTVGPLSNSPLSPRDFFKSLITESLPTFSLSGYDAILDPVFQYHLRVTLDSVNDVKTLIAMWETGSRTVKMREMPSAGSLVESVSALRSRDRLDHQRSAYVSRDSRA